MANNWQHQADDIIKAVTPLLKRRSDRIQEMDKNGVRLDYRLEVVRAIYKDIVSDSRIKKRFDINDPLVSQAIYCVIMESFGCLHSYTKQLSEMTHHANPGIRKHRMYGLREEAMYARMQTDHELQQLFKDKVLPQLMQLDNMNGVALKDLSKTLDIINKARDFNHKIPPVFRDSDEQEVQESHHEHIVNLLMDRRPQYIEGTVEQVDA